MATRDFTITPLNVSKLRPDGKLELLRRGMRIWEEMDELMDEIILAGRDKIPLKCASGYVIYISSCSGRFKFTDDDNLGLWHHHLRQQITSRIVRVFVVGCL